MASIVEFIKTGKLGFLYLGISKGKVEEILGKPSDFSLSKKPVILKYDALQLSFFGEREGNGAFLNSIHLYFDDRIVFPKELCLKGWIPTNHATQNELFERAEKDGIILKKNKQLTFGDSQAGYESDVGVTIIFDTEDKKDRLISINVTKR